MDSFKCDILLQFNPITSCIKTELSQIKSRRRNSNNDFEESDNISTFTKLRLIAIRVEKSY